MRLCHALPYRFWELSVPCSFTSGDILVLLKRRKCCIDSSRNILLIDIMDRTHIYTVSIPTYMVQTRVLFHNILTSKHKNYGLWIFIYTFKIQQLNMYSFSGFGCAQISIFTSYPRIILVYQITLVESSVRHLVYVCMLFAYLMHCILLFPQETWQMIFILSQLVSYYIYGIAFTLTSKLHNLLPREGNH